MKNEAATKWPVFTCGCSERDVGRVERLQRLQRHLRHRQPVTWSVMWQSGASTWRHGLPWRRQWSPDVYGHSLPQWVQIMQSLDWIFLWIRLVRVLLYYSRTLIYRIFADCEIRYIRRNFYLFCTMGAENIRYIQLSDITETDITEFYCIWIIQNKM